MQTEGSPGAREKPYGLKPLMPLLQDRVSTMAYPRNKVILKEQDRLNNVLLIVDGIAKVRSFLSDGSEEVLGILGSGECIGISCVFGAVHSWGDLVSITELQLVRLPKEAAIALILEQPVAAFHFMAMKSGCLATVRERVMSRHLQPTERVLATLMELARK